MKLSVILAGTALASVVAYNAYSLTCGAQPSCSSLGYTYTGSTADCVGTPLKCPFNSSYFNCTKKAEVYNNMKLDWGNKVTISFNTYYYPTRYGCVWGNAPDKGNGASFINVNGTQIQATYQGNDGVLVYTCLAPGDYIKVTVGSVQDVTKLYFVPYKGN